MQTISLRELRRRLRTTRPNNHDRVLGFALVNVLPPAEFLAEHIPHSLNIPVGQEKEFERKFDRSKEIIVYGASDSCPRAHQMALALASMGYTNIREFDEGAEGWRENTKRDTTSSVEFGGSSNVFEMSIA